MSREKSEILTRLPTAKFSSGKNEGSGNMLVQNKYDTVSISREVARKCGVSAAHVFSYLSNWINFNALHDKNVIDGKVWTFGTAKEICDGVEFFSLRTIKNALSKLVDAGYITKGNFNKSAIDRTMWYTLGNVAIQQKTNTIPKVQNLHNAKCKNCKMQSAKFAQPIPNKEIKNIKQQSGGGTPAPAREIDSSVSCAKTERATVRRLPQPTPEEFYAWQKRMVKKFAIQVYAIDACSAAYRKAVERGWKTPAGIHIANWKKYFSQILLSRDSQFWRESSEMLDIEES